MEFVKFKRAVHAQFNRLAAGADMLFLTNVDKDALWDCYLNSFPEEERQSHNCNNCKHYIRHYGRVVAIKDNKVVTMWENLQLDEPYATVARNLDALVKSKPVVDVFITRDYELGIDRNNVYIDSLQGRPLNRNCFLYGPIVQWIERWSTEPEMAVRLCLGLLT